MSARKATNKPRDYNALDRVEPALPAAWYHDEEHYQRELRAIWQAHWIYLCRSEVLAEPGAYQTLGIGRQNVFVVRTTAGALAGYFNTCRHRGSALVREPAGRMRPNVINCPYHAWCYSLEDGRLLATTSFTEPHGFERSEHGLFEIAVKEWRGSVWVNLDAGARWDTDEVFGDTWQNLQNFPLESWVLGHQWSRPIACNWKTFWDNYNECLHCPVVHPGLIELVPLFKRGLLDEKDHPEWRAHRNTSDPRYRRGLRAGAETFSEDGSAQGYGDTAALSDDDRSRGVTYGTALPSTYIAAHSDHARIVRIVPTGPESIELSVDWLFKREALDDPDYDTGNVTNFLKRVLTEDAAICELNQNGMRSEPFEHGVLMPEEYELKAFRVWLDGKLSGA